MADPANPVWGPVSGRGFPSSLSSSSSTQPLNPMDRKASIVAQARVQDPDRYDVTWTDYEILGDKLSHALPAISLEMKGWFNKPASLRDVISAARSDESSLAVIRFEIADLDTGGNEKNPIAAEVKKVLLKVYQESTDLLEGEEIELSEEEEAEEEGGFLYKEDDQRRERTGKGENVLLTLDRLDRLDPFELPGEVTGRDGQPVRRKGGRRELRSSYVHAHADSRRVQARGEKPWWLIAALILGAAASYPLVVKPFYQRFFCVKK